MVPEASINSLFQQALTLTAAQRAELAHRLIDSLVANGEDSDELEPGYEAYWEAELRRQDEEIATGTANLIPFDEAMERMLGPLDR